MTEWPLDAPVYLHTIDWATVLPQSSHKRQLLAISAATCAESGLLAYGAGYFVMALWLGAISSAAFSWSSASGELDDPQVIRHVAVRTVFALTLIILMTTVVLPILRIPHRLHGRAGSSRTASPPDADQRTGDSAQPRSETGGRLATGIRDAYSGIVLRPKKQTRTRLVAPSPMSWSQKFVSARPSSLLVIPFDGVYWLFREPDIQPPAQSRQAEGSPEMFDIHSTDWHPLSMEAHQNLGTLIGLDCCARIRVAIRNADEYPTSISVELILVDTTAPGRPSQSLGRVDIVSDRGWKPVDRPKPASETLNFSIPSNSAIRRFDEVTVLFRLERFRARTAAKIAVDHFTLVPRGL